MKKRMRQTNRILSFLLFVLMLLSTAPVTVFAAGETCVCGFTPHKCFTSIGDAFTDYTVIEVGGSYFVLADGDGEVLNDGILKADEDDKIQLKESWVVFPEAPVTAFDGKLSVSDIALTDDDGEVLVEGKDYTLYLISDSFEKDRLYCLAVEGKGDYCGTVFTLITIDPCMGDVNADGRIDDLDAVAILKYDEGLIEEF